MQAQQVFKVAELGDIKVVMVPEWPEEDEDLVMEVAARTAKSRVVNTHVEAIKRALGALRPLGFFRAELRVEASDFHPAFVVASARSDSLHSPEAVLTYRLSVFRPEAAEYTTTPILGAESDGERAYQGIVNVCRSWISTPRHGASCTRYQHYYVEIAGNLVSVQPVTRVDVEYESYEEDQGYVTHGAVADARVRLTIDTPADPMVIAMECTYVENDFAGRLRCRWPM